MVSLDFKTSLNIIKSKVSFNQVLESYGITPSSTKLIRCPLHSEEKGSFKVYDGDSGDGSFWCFGCQKGGDMLSFVEYFENISKGEALRKLATTFKIDVTTREYSNDLLDSIVNLLKPKKATFGREILNQLRVSSECNNIFSALTQENITPYMERKKIVHLGTKSRGNDLVIPVCDSSGHIWGLQYIMPNGSKIFHPECKRKECMFRLGPEPLPDSVVYLTEGYSTGVSVYLSTYKTTIVCFSSNNFVPVYNILSWKYPQTNFIVAGDNDKSGKSHNIPAIYPEKLGQDWNDVYVEQGPSGVSKGLTEGKILYGMLGR